MLEKQKNTYVYEEPYFYITEDRYENTKEIFLFLSKLISKNYQKNDNIDICDHGTATGELPYYLQKIFKKADIKACDVSEILLEKAIKQVPKVKFFKKSVLDSECWPPRSHDINTCIGVLQVFDEFEPTIDNLINWTKDRGTVYLHGLFNNFPLDVDIKYNYSKNRNTSVKERGWNIFSKDSISSFLEKNKRIKSYKFYDFEIKIDLEKKEDKTHNHIRSWTFEDASGKKIITNGLNIMQPHCILEIQLH